MLVSALLLLTPAAIVAPAPARPHPQVAVAELLAAERDFSARVAGAADPVATFASMMTDDVIFPSPQRGLVRGREAVIQMLRAYPAHSGAASWRPIRAGVSADGTHGFSFGYFDLAAGDPARRGRRYLAYWVKRPEGWRVAAYRQFGRGAGERMLESMPLSLPAAAAGGGDHGASLAAAEQAFSDRAQQVGLRAAFTEYGRADAINAGSPAGFVVGADAIGRALFDEAKTSPVHWKADHVLVAPSGDLGITFGFVRSHEPQAGQPGEFPFFTIWRRDGPGQPWRYIAE